MNNLTPEIKQTPAVLTFNYETFKADLEKQLEKYRTVVTADTVKQAKETATELNALKIQLDTQRKEAIRYVSAPIKTADDQMKECVGLVASGRQEILDQVAKFDQVRLDGLKEELTGRRDRLRKEAGISAKFQGTADDLSDLVKLTNLTGTDRLTNKAAQAVADRVNAELQLQNTVERRLLELENASYRAGLSSPLERAHVELFLFQDDDTYQSRLQQLLDVEIERQKKSEDKMRQTVQREQDQKYAEAQREQERQERLSAEQTPNYEMDRPDLADDAGLLGDPGHGGYAVPDEAPTEPTSEAPKTQAPGETETYLLTCTMTATLPAGMNEADIEAQFREFIQGAGNTRVDWMTVTREKREDAA